MAYISAAFSSKRRISCIWVRRRRASSVSSRALGSATFVCAMTLPPHERQLVHREAAAEPEYGHDDGEADRDLGGRHAQDEEDERLPVDRAVALAEGHERQIGGVEHDLDGHEDDERIAPDEHAESSDDEQHRRHSHVIRGGHHDQATRRLASAITPTRARRRPATGTASRRCGRSGSGPVSSRPGISTMMAKTKRMAMAPAYTMTCAVARNSARISRKSAARVARCATRKSALWMGFRLSTTPAADATTMAARTQKVSSPAVMTARSGSPAWADPRGWAPARWAHRWAPPGRGPATSPWC